MRLARISLLLLFFEAHPGKNYEEPIFGILCSKDFPEVKP
jgi:hypothetical protein